MNMIAEPRSHEGTKVLEPELRFAEFNNRWDIFNLSEVTKINQGLQIAISNRLTEPKEGAHFYITNEFLRAGNKKNYYIENPPKSVICSEDDLLMTRTGNTGQVVTGVNGAFHNNFFKIAYSEEVYRLFLYYFLTSFRTQKQILRLAGTSTIPDLNHSDFYRIKIDLPTLEEQQKIADFLSSVDKKIEQLTEKHRLLTEYKKGTMQQIFSQQIRFKDDNGNDYPEWEEKKLGELIDNRGGTALESLVSKNGTHKFISIGNYSTDGKYIDNGQRISPEGKAKQKLLNKNDLVMVLNDKTASGDLIGSSILIDEDDAYIYNQRSERIICNGNLVSEFAWHLFNSKEFRKKVVSLSQGGTQIYINFSTIKSILIGLPEIEEQQKIANFLTEIDQKIDQAWSTLEQTKAFKKGLLQKMFV